MSGNSVIVDSNIIILASKQEINLENLVERYDNFYASIITYMEVMGFKNISAEERLIIDNFFDNIEIIEIDKEIAEIVIDYKVNSEKKIKLPDAIILATAKLVTADLYTQNNSDFEGVDKTVNIINNLTT